MAVPSRIVTFSNVAIGNEQTVWTPAAGQRWRLQGMSFSVSAAVSVVFRDGPGGTAVWRTPVLQANTAYTFKIDNDGIPAAAADTALVAQASGAATATGTVFGLDEVMP